MRFRLFYCFGNQCLSPFALIVPSVLPPIIQMNQMDK